MRFLLLLAFLVVASVPAATVHEYYDGRWKELIVNRPRPEYPLEARRARLQGQGFFRLSFARDGRVTSVTTLRSAGHEILDAAAIKAFRQWRAKPGRRHELDTPVSWVVVWRRDSWILSTGVPRTVLREFDD